eukprot:1152714-Pelagomonas_calceolata.AAC.2
MVRHPSQLLLEQRRIHLMEAKYCEGTLSKNQLEASKQQHCNLCCNFSRAPAQTATKLVLKLHAHSVQYAHKLASTRRALEKTSFTSHHQDQARATAISPPDPH